MGTSQPQPETGTTDCIDAAISAKEESFLSRDPDMEQSQSGEDKEVSEQVTFEDDAPYCILPERRKIAVILTASFMGMVSPMSAGIYYPALPALARDMQVSNSLINLSITTYLVCPDDSPQ